ncbi:ABC transporter family protein [Leishmania donovani]|uniref:ABC transporter family protein n=1 Tax=Leishmania donovani TaxID=5661 RepID=A0A504XDZ1_LEIDO|nr:ABC transporter family protein [Leishmania donovani]
MLRRGTPLLRGAGLYEGAVARATTVYGPFAAAALRSRRGVLAKRQVLGTHPSLKPSVLPGYSAWSTQARTLVCISWLLRTPSSTPPSEDQKKKKFQKRSCGATCVDNLQKATVLPSDASAAQTGGDGAGAASNEVEVTHRLGMGERVAAAGQEAQRSPHRPLPPADQPASPGDDMPFNAAQKTSAGDATTEPEISAKKEKPTASITTPPRLDGIQISENASDIPVGRVLWKMWTYLWPHGEPKIKMLVASSVLCVLVAKVLRVAVPFWFKTIVDLLAPTTATAEAVTVAGPLTVGVFGCVVAYGICRITTFVSEELKTVLFAPVGGHASTKLSMEMFNKLHQLDLDYHLSRETGVLSKDLDRGSRAFWSLAYVLLFMIAPTIFEMGLVCYALNSQAGPQFIGIALIAVFSYVAWTFLVTNWRSKFRTRYNALESRVGGLIVDSLLNYETIKYFGSEKYESERIRKETENMNKKLVILDQTMALLNFGQQLIFVVASVLSLYLATCGVLTGAMTVGDLVLVDALLMQLYMPLSYLGMIYREVQSSTQNMQAMIALLDQKSNVKDKADAETYKYIDGTIELHDVTFEYKKELNRLVLRNLSLKIPGGKTVAFVGPSGSGKSTIFRLLFRFYDPTSGQVLLDGQPLDKLRMESVRKCIGVIPQDTVLFNESVRYNIRYGRMDATDAEVEAAARAASLHDTIARMSEGYDTSVGERGLRLSGGEKQRISIARVLLRDPPILLADEATSALDSMTELNVMETLKNATERTRRRTIVLVAHRLTTVKEADIIFVLDGKGGLAEQGTHAELLDKGGLYAAMWHQQLNEQYQATGDTSFAQSLNGYGDYDDEDSTAFASPGSFSPHAYHSHTKSLTPTPPPSAVASPMLILGDASDSAALDREVQPEEQHIEEFVPLPAKSSQVLPALSFHSSFFSYTTDSSISAEPLLTSKSPALVTYPSSTASPGGRAPLQRTGSSSPQMLAEIQTTISQLTTSSFPMPPPLVAASAMTTQVLPCCTDDEGQHCSRASSPAMASSPLSPWAPRTADRPQAEERELRRSGSSAKDPGAADTVLTLPLTALDELPPPTPLSSSSFFSASPSVASPLSAVAASLNETPVRASLSHLATSLLYADGADPLADERHTQSRINTAALPWVPMLLPTMPCPKRRQQRGTNTLPPHAEGHGDAQCVAQADDKPAAKRRRTRKGTKEEASTTGEVVLIAERGMPAPAPLPQPPSARRRRTSKTATKDAHQSAAPTRVSKNARLAPMPRAEAPLDQKENCDGAQGLKESSKDHSSASRTEPGHISLPPNSAKPSTALHPQELMVLAGDVPLSHLFATSSDLNADSKSTAPAACQPPAAPSVPSQSQRERWRRTRFRKAGVPQTAAAAVEDGAAPSAGRVAAEASREEAEPAPAAATSLPLCLSSPRAPQLPARSEKLDGSGAKAELPASGDTSAARSLGAARRGKTSTFSLTLPARKRRTLQTTPAVTTETPSSTGGGDTSGSDGAVTHVASTSKRAADVQPSLLQAWWSAVCTSASSSESGRSCLWVELSEGYQEAHGTLLRQVLVYWGWLHSESSVTHRGGLELPTGASTLSSSTPKCTSRKRARDRKRSETSAAGASAQLERTDRRANNGLVVLLCPSPLPMEEALRWWTQRAHVEHSFMPPLLAVSMSADPQSSVLGSSDRVPSASRVAPTPEEEYELLRGAIQLASSVYCTDAARSLAVSCTAAGHAALAQLLSLNQVFDSLQVCADALRSAAGLPSTSSLVQTPLEEDADVGSLTAVLAVTALVQGTDSGSGSAKEGRRAASLQERYFAELCRWNGLAAALQRQPRRPQLVLRRVRVDPLHRNGGASKRKKTPVGPTVPPSALMDASEGVLYAPSVAGSSLLPEERRQWVTYGMVLPATRNEDTFASSARREDRVLASQPPPVALAPAHLSALHLFGRVLFTPGNYATAVNVVESYARVSQQCLTDYISDYSCVMTGPLRYSVSATIRRYLQVRVVVELAPLLALVSNGAAAQPLASTRLSAAGACISPPSTSTLLAPVALFARSKWRTVVLSLSCTCKPRLYEQVPRTDDGVKVCRHVAELFHYFTTQQFSVVGHQAVQREQPLPQHQVQRALARVDPMLYSRSLPPLSPRTTSSEKRQLSHRSRTSTSTSSSNSSTNAILSSLPLPALYTRFFDLCAASEGTARKQEKNEVSGSDSTDSASPARPPARCRSLQRSATAALSPATPSKAPRTRPSKKAQRSSTAAAANASVTSSVAASAAGTDFHTQALQYALRLLQERLRDGSGERTADGGAASLAAAAATGDGGLLFRPSGPSPPALARKRTRSEDVSPGETEHARALRLVEQLLRDQLR